ncbi:MAG TPA: hypothetical protein VLX68_01475 [Chitinivibrionales bacterium]|nr:hypothetical protein [Chitinivibrionales bacterium]
MLNNLLFHCNRGLLLSAAILTVSIFVMFAYGAQNAVPTFECIGLYWSPGNGSAAISCTTSYREKNTIAWQQAMPLWYDARNTEYRGSIVNLKPNTTYEIHLTLQGTISSTTFTATTWNENFPIAKTVNFPSGTSNQTITISESGTSTGYILYAPATALGSTIDVNNAADYCIDIKGSYIIVNGAILKGAARDGVNLENNVHDVVIEQCDISGWGRIASDGWGVEQDAGVKGWFPSITRIVVQGNKIHHPRSNANNWTESRTIYNEGTHPDGPEAIVFLNSAGNNVFRYNEVYSDESHCFNDGISGSDNSSTQGFPGPNSDIYGNMIKNTNDDAIEADGGGCNIRVFKNYLDTTYCGISACAMSVGPGYFFRNVMAHSRMAPTSSEVGVFAKTGDITSVGVGRQYWFHNTVLQPGGAGEGVSGSGAQSVTMLVSYNNIWNAGNSIDPGNSSTANIFDYDLCSGNLKTGYVGQESHGIKGVPVFAPGNGKIAGNIGMFQLDSKSPGYDAGLILPDFNDGYYNKGPDCGAQEAMSAPMVFGVTALGADVKMSRFAEHIQRSSSFAEKIVMFKGIIHPRQLTSLTSGYEIYSVRGELIGKWDPSQTKREGQMPKSAEGGLYIFVPQMGK